MPVPHVARDPPAESQKLGNVFPGMQGWPEPCGFAKVHARGLSFCKGRGNHMKTNVNRKPQGHSAKRWHGPQQKDLVTARQSQQLKTRSSREPIWRQRAS